MKSISLISESRNTVVNVISDWKIDWLENDSRIALGKKEDGSICLINHDKYGYSIDNDFETKQELIEYYNTGNIKDY